MVAHGTVQGQGIVIALDGAVKLTPGIGRGVVGGGGQVTRRHVLVAGPEETETVIGNAGDVDLVHQPRVVVVVIPGELGAEVVGEVVKDRHRGVLQVAVVRVLPTGDVIGEGITLQVAAGNLDTAALTNGDVDHGLEVLTIELVEGGLELDPEFLGGLGAVDVDYPANRISTEQRTLGTPQYFH